jgi:hypothetical protein
MKIILFITSFVGITLSGFSQFDAIKKDTSIKVSKPTPKSYPGITEIKPHKVFFKTENAELFHRGQNGYKLVFSWWSLANNNEEELTINFNKSDIKVYNPEHGNPPFRFMVPPRSGAW